MSNLLPAKELGRRLKELRDEKGWTQSELAAEMRRPDGEVSQGEVSRWERGGVVPEYSTIAMWASALGVPVESFTTEEARSVRETRAGYSGEPTLLSVLDRESRIAERRLDLASQHAKAAETEAEAALRRAHAAEEWAIAARLAEENARALRQGLLDRELEPRPRPDPGEGERKTA